MSALKFDHTKFFDSYRTAFGSLSQAKVDGLESLLTSLEADTDVDDVRWAAYMLATVKHECADTWHPIEEFGKGKGRPYGKPVTITGSDGQPHTNVYYGRGYVQLTWQKNYETMGEALNQGDSLVIDPAKVLDPVVAYDIMSYGMRHGSFTGKKLADYINDQATDYKNARRIINGLDQWQKIQGYAQTLETSLKQSLIT